MENSNIEGISPCFFTYIFIFSSISQERPKKWVNFFYLRFSGKLPHNLILLWIIQKSNSFSHIFSSSSSFFASISQKCPKSGLSFFFTDLRQNLHQSDSFFHIFSSSFSFLSWFIKNSLKNESKLFFLWFLWKFSVDSGFSNIPYSKKWKPGNAEN